MFLKRESHIFLSVGACFSVMIASMRIFARIDIGVRGLVFLWDLCIFNLQKLVTRVRNELGI